MVRVLLSIRVFVIANENTRKPGSLANTLSVLMMTLTRSTRVLQPLALWATSAQLSTRVVGQRGSVFVTRLPTL